MKLIVITRPTFFPGESEAVTALFRNGLELLHLRKPGATPAELEHFLNELPADCLSRIVIHDHFSLATAYPLKGIHLNSRHPQPPVGYAGQVSRSCHSLDEAAIRKAGCSYIFLSPIFDSISKEGYAAAYSPESLVQARKEGIIDHRVVALGGICLQNLAEVKALGFGGAALLGDIWQQPETCFIPHFLAVKACADPQ